MMRVRVRGEPLLGSTHVGTSYVNNVPVTNYVKVWPSDAWITKEYCCDELHSGPPYRSGGPLEKYLYVTNRDEVKGFQTVKSGLSSLKYTGGFLPFYSPTDYLDFTPLQHDDIMNWGDHSSFGAEAWNKFRPGKPKAPLGEALVEARDLPRMLRTTAKGFRDLWKQLRANRRSFTLREYANHYLNFQFGWKPFVHDLKSFIKTTYNFSKQYEQLCRDNGRWVRRGGSVLTDGSSVLRFHSNTTGHWPVLDSWSYLNPSGSFAVYDTRETRVWFSAAFRYWMPNLIKFGKYNPLTLLNVYGMNPTPSLIWEVTPWSWLVDWASNVGDVIANLSASVYDNLVAKYAYIMATTSQKVTVISTSRFAYAPLLMNSWQAQIVRKQRVEACPFGFTLELPDMTPRQTSILLALGISRMRAID